MTIRKTLIFPMCELLHWKENGEDRLAVIHKVQFTDNGSVIIDGRVNFSIPWTVLSQVLDRGQAADET